LRLPSSVAIRLVRVTVFFWAGIHALVFMLGLQDPALATRALLVSVVLALALLDVRATNERILYANLAIGTPTVIAVVLVVAVALEASAVWVVANLVPPGFLELPF